MRTKLVTAATESPVTLDELKANPSLHVTETADDAWLDQYVNAVALRYEQLTQCILMSSTWDLYLDTFPCRGYIELPAPLTSVTSVKYYDTNNVEQTWAAAEYDVDLVSVPVSRLALAYGYSWPLTYSRMNAVTIRFVAGYTAANIPADLKPWLIEWIAGLYDGNQDKMDIAENMMRAAGRWQI